MVKITATHTFALLSLPRETYNKIREILMEAKYDHAIDDDEECLDMHGIGIVPED